MGAPILLCDTAGMTNDQWLECRMHGPTGTIPYTIGGSDVATVFGVSPWRTPLELWNIKKGIMEPPPSDNADQLEMGHLLEPVVAHWYAKKSGNKIFTDTGLYQHSDYPFALANLDYGMEEDGNPGLLECKSTSFRMSEHWADGAVPYYYELQVRFYLAVMDREFADIACLWGTNPETDMVIRRINRDRAIEADIFERLQEFVDSLYANKPPTMAGINPELAMKALARIVASSQKGLPDIEFGPKFEKQIRRIAVLQAENETLSEQIKNNGKEITAHSVRIAEAMKTHEHGIFEVPGERFLIDYATKVTNRVDTALLKSKYPLIHGEVLRPSNSRKLKITLQTP